MTSFFLVKKIFLTYLLLAAGLLLALLCYRPGLDGSFIFDDTVNIVENTSLRIDTLDTASLKEAAFSMGQGVSVRPISMASFALNYYFGELKPFGFKLTNLLIHLLNATCLFFLTKLILKTYYQQHRDDNAKDLINWISLSTAVMWVLHPLNLSTVLYVVQRMTSLSALFVLLGLISYSYGRQQQQKTKWVWISSSFILFTPLAVLSKENGALLPLYLLLIEIIFFRFRTSSSRERWILGCIYLATVGLPILLLVVYTTYNSAWITGGYAIRDFTLSERLMTEARILWFYIRLIFMPDISAMGFYHDDIPISHGLLQPLTTIPAILGILALVAAGFILRKRYPIAAFGIGFYLIGHSIESTVISLELVHEHRNYLPMYGLLLALSFYIFSPTAQFISPKFKKILPLVIIVLFAGVTTIRAAQWGDTYTFHYMEATHHPESLRANTDLAYIYAFLPAFSNAEAEEYYQTAMKHYQRAHRLSISDASGLLGLVGLSAQRHRPVDNSWLEDLGHRLAHFPFSPSYTNSLMSLEKCVSQGPCKSLSPLDMDRLLQAALSNPTLYGQSRGNLLFSRSHLLVTSLGKREEAKELAFKAVNLMPSNLRAQITFVKVLINLDERQKAKQQLEKIKRQGNVGRYSYELNELEAILAAPGSF